MDENNAEWESYQERNYTQQKYAGVVSGGAFLLCRPHRLSRPRRGFRIIRAGGPQKYITTAEKMLRNIQDYAIRCGHVIILLVTGLVQLQMNEVIKMLEQPDISALDILVKAGHMRMVCDGDIKVWYRSKHPVTGSEASGRNGVYSPIRHKEHGLNRNRKQQ